MKVDWKKAGEYWTIFILGFFSFFFMLVLKHPVGLSSIINPYAFQAYSLYDMNDPVVINISDYCLPFDDDKLKVECVVNKVGEFFQFNENMTAGMEIRTPTEIKELGGAVCRDASVMYMAIFKRMGFRTDAAFTNNHVFTYIWKDNIYCTIDQLLFECYTLS